MIVGFEAYHDKYDFSGVKGVIHVGAHHGQEYWDYIKTFGPDIKTHWFEPLPEAFQILKQNLGDKPGVQLYNCALGPEESRMRIWRDSGNGGQSSSLLPPKDHVEQWSHITFSHDEEVMVGKLDNLSISDANVLVIDAQGFELEVLRGSKETLSTIDHVFCEINSKEMYEGCPTVFDLNWFLEDMGFVQREQWWTNNHWGDGYWSR